MKNKRLDDFLRKEKVLTKFKKNLKKFRPGLSYEEFLSHNSGPGGGFYSRISETPEGVEFWDAICFKWIKLYQ